MGEWRRAMRGGFYRWLVVGRTEVMGMQWRWKSTA